MQGPKNFGIIHSVFLTFALDKPKNIGYYIGIEDNDVPGNVIVFFYFSGR